MQPSLLHRLDLISQILFVGSATRRRGAGSFSHADSWGPNLRGRLGYKPDSSLLPRKYS
jgi:hypothetical protein